MKRRTFTVGLGIASLVTVGAIACAQAPVPPTVEPEAGAAPSEAPIALTISAAASVQAALKEIQAAYQKAAPNVTLTYNFGPSGSLAQQIAQGAPVDIFLSASPQWMSELEDKGQVVVGSRQDALNNTLVLIVAKDKTDVTDFADLATDAVGKLAMGEPESVPAGNYAKAALTSLNLFDPLQPKLVFAKDVWQVLAYVETGNADAGLLYATDAQTSDQVKIVATAAPETHPPIVYPIAVVKSSPNPEAAQAFIDFLQTDTATQIFESYGFTMAE